LLGYIPEVTRNLFSAVWRVSYKQSDVIPWRLWLEFEQTISI